MASGADVRNIAMALEGVSEIDHWNRPAFRTTKRIFAVIRPDGLYLHLTDERKEFLFEADPEIFTRYMWGKRPELIVSIQKIGKRELKALIGEAYAHAKPAEKQPARKPATHKVARRPRIR